MQIYLEAFLSLFVAINLPGVLPLYIGLTEGATDRHDHGALTGGGQLLS